jgi:hypothetical protein
MALVCLVVLAAIGALLPPFFTGGKCTAEFDAAAAEMDGLKTELATVKQARAYLSAHSIPFTEISAEQCENSPPPGVEYCSDGPLLLAVLPVKDRVCSFYRDDEIKVQLLYGRSLQLRRYQTDMKPFRKLELPFFGIEIDWAR